MRLIFLGDLCVTEDGLPALSPLATQWLESADSVCLNFEGPLAGAGLNPSPKAGPAIHQPESVIRFLHDCHVTHCGLANNHIMDYGRAGLKTTLESLHGFACLGAGLSVEAAYRASLIELQGLRIALLAFGEAQFGVLDDKSDEGTAGFAWIDHPHARRAVQNARKTADWVLVQVHAGLEMVDIPLPEWRARYRELIDLGADMVIGHHPHVTQGSEEYAGKYIHYSLGNFYMGSLFNVGSGSGSALEVVIDGNGLSSVVIPLHLSQGEIDLDKSIEARDRYQKLCNKLKGEAAYLQEIQIICDAHWADIYARYYESALTGLGTRPSLASAKRVLRRFAGICLKGRRHAERNELLLLHNIQIESHRWVVQRALSKSI